MNLETIETKRLILKRFLPKDFVYLFENFSENEIQQMLGHQFEEEYLKEKNKYENGYETHSCSFLYFQIIDKATNQIIGGCGFHNWFAIHRRAELGYSLSVEEFKGLGLMSEALEPVIDYGFSKMDLNRMEAFVSPENTPSLKLMAKFDFEKEGVLKQHYFNIDKFEDSIVFCRLAV